MTSPGSSASDSAEQGGQLPQRVAELAGELTEAREESRRRRVARQISELATRSGQAASRRIRAGRGAAAGRARTAGGGAWLRARASGSATWRGVRAAGDWLTAQAVEMAPRVPIRSIATLRTHYPGLDTEQLAEQLIAGAARASAGIGIAVGAAAAVPFVPTMPVELGVEALALVAVELKLVAELHEVYGQQAPGSTRQRMLAYLTAWSQRRGVRLTSNGLTLAVGTPVRRQLERRLLAKAGQSAFAFAPLLTGAAAGGVIDHHETRRLGHLVRDDLRKRAAAGPAS